MIKIYIVLVLLFISILVLTLSIILKNKLNKELNKKVKLVRVNKLIEVSGVALKIKHYNSLVHIILSITCFVLTFIISKRILGNVSSLIFSTLLLLGPSAALSILEKNKVGLARKETLNFIDIFSNQMLVNTNIFDAMRSSTEFLNEPVKNVTKRTLDMYDKKIDPVKCLKYMSDSLPGVEVKSFFNTLEYYFIEGGDISNINDEFLVELTELVEIDNKESSEDYMMFISLYAMVALNLIVIMLTLKSDVSSFVTNTVYGEIALSINLSLCLAIVIKTLTKGGEV